MGQCAPQTQTTSLMTRRDDSSSSLSLPSAHSSMGTSLQPQGSAATPSVFRARVPSSVWTAPRHYSSSSSSEANARSPTQTRSSAQPFHFPPLPSRQALDRIIDICQQDAWLFAEINGCALSDVAVLLDSTSSAESEYMTARALLSATIAIGLPLLLSAIPSGISASSTFKGMDDLLRSHAQLELPRLDDPLWMSIITRLYADCARGLVAQAQAKSGGYSSPATFVVRVILAEVSHAQSTIASAQVDLALAASQARLLHLHISAPGAHPRMSVGPVRNTHLSRALRGLMQAKEEPFAFWSLFLLDCFQSRLARLPVTIERQCIRMPFPRRVEAGDPTTSPMPHSLDQTEAHILQRRGLPVIEDLDNSMSLPVKVS